MKQNARPAGPALKHSLGQNFILDPALQQELAGLTGLGPDDEVLEIGAGSGMLTQALADRVKQAEFIVFENTSRENELREKNWEKYINTAYRKGKELFSI